MKRLIYKSKEPVFTISADRFQWILEHRGLYGYYPNLSNLLDELAETMFREYPKKLKEFKDIDQSIQKVYDLIDRVAKDLKKLEGGGNK